MAAQAVFRIGSLAFSTASKSNARGVEIRIGEQLGPRDEPVGQQELRADQEPVAGESGRRLIGGSAIADRAKGKHLPPALTHASERAEEVRGGWPQVADAETPRKRRRMQDESRRAGKASHEQNPQGGSASRIPPAD